MARKKAEPSDSTEQVEMDEIGNPQQDTPQTASTGALGIAIHDVAAVLVLLTLWGAADTWHSVSGLTIALVASVGNAFLAGALIAALVHEWGHYAGATLSGGATTLVKPRGFSIFRFRYHFSKSTERNFQWMTYGGNIAHWALVVITAWLLPLDNPSRIAFLSATFAFAVFASTIEAPVLWRNLNGMNGKESLNMLDKATFNRSYAVGGIAGLFLFALLT